jgi:5-formyltetrahydrofolate cyclo-ligase
VSDIDPRKTLRTLMRQRRKALDSVQQQQAAIQLKDQLISHKKIQSAQRIALYLAVNGELDLTPFIHWCWEQQKELYLPVIHPFTQGHLLFLNYNDKTTLINNHYNIQEPTLDVRTICPVNNLDVICTPLVAFDDSGARLGMGGGFYDRTLAMWFEQTKQAKQELNNSNINLYPIGIAHQCQRVDKVPIEVWDIPLPEIITPLKIIKNF